MEPSVAKKEFSWDKSLMAGKERISDSMDIQAKQYFVGTRLQYSEKRIRIDSLSMRQKMKLKYLGNYYIEGFFRFSFIQ